MSIAERLVRTPANQHARFHQLQYTVTVTVKIPGQLQYSRIPIVYTEHNELDLLATRDPGEGGR